MATFNTTMKYDVVLSFAGEQRGFAENLAKIIRYNGFRVFYDDFEQSEIWGEELNRYLGKIYGVSGKYCVMFISKDYQRKPYPYRERLSAINRFFDELGSSYLLLIQVDDTDIPEVPSSIAHLDLREKSIIDVGELLVKKLGASLFIIPDDLDFANLRVGQNELPDIRQHLASLSAACRNTVRCPSCQAPFDITKVPTISKIHCPNCGTIFDPTSQIESLVRSAVEARGKYTKREPGQILTIKIARYKYSANNVTCCHCRANYFTSDSDMKEKAGGLFILIYNRTAGKQTFLFFCKKCLSKCGFVSDIDIDAMNMYPTFSYY